MQERLKQELPQILQVLQILSPTSFSWAGTTICIGEPQQKQPPHLDEQKNLLVEHLVRQLYHHCYCRPFKADAIYQPIVPEPDEEFVNALSEANTTVERLDPGWHVLRRLPTEHYFVQKNDLIRAVAPGELISHDGPGVVLREGTPVNVVCRKESRTMHPGFYYVFGATITDQQDEDDLLRFYWNIKAEGAPVLVHLLTSRLNHFQIPFRFKCLNNPNSYNRLDAAVLYLNIRFYRLATELLAEVHKQVADYLEPDAPLFSKQLAVGLGLAEEPGDGESFGQQRCRILAEGMWNAYELKLQTEHERLQEVIKHFELKGLSLDNPHLNQGSIDQYDFPVRPIAV